MRRGSFQAISPDGLMIEAVTTEPDRLLIVARPTASDASCPACGLRSSQVHSRYDRRLTDLPSHGRAVHLRIQVRRFRCAAVACPRRIFGEPLADSIAPRAARRTARLESVVHHLGVALGGRPGASLARRLMLPVSRDTPLPVLRRRAPVIAGPVHVIGVDDFAWKRGQRYGTVVCDLEHRRIIDLLPDREGATVAAWLAAHPEITVVSRDRGAGYGHAALPCAVLLAPPAAQATPAALFDNIRPPAGVTLSAIDSKTPITVVLTLPMRDRAGAEAYGNAVSDPDNALYGHYIKPAEFGARFGGDAGIYEFLRNWAVGNGLTPGQRSDARLDLSVTGTARQFAGLFRTSFAGFTTKEHGDGRVTLRQPILPDALAGRVIGVVGLSSYAHYAPLYRLKGGPRADVGTGYKSPFGNSGVGCSA